MMNSTLLSTGLEVVFWLSAITTTYIGFTYFRDLGDVVQMVLKVKRENMAHKIRNERHVWAFGALGLAITSTSFWLGAGSAWGMTLTWLLNLIFFGFTFIWVHIGLRSQQNSAKYYSIEQAKDYINPATSVIVIENKGQARAHPDYELMRPHLAGDEQGLSGENVIMTYCAMSNLGVAYHPEIAGEKLKLSVVAQHGNNLIMRDETTGAPIQQISGVREQQANVCPLETQMKTWPSFRMSFAGFAKAYPNGEVFLNLPDKNPLLRLFDLVMDIAFSVGISKQHRYQAPVMDNMDHYDERLPNKSYIWGISINNDHVCYTKDFVQEQQNLINTTVGGRKVVVAYSPSHDSIGVFYNPDNTNIEQIDFFGNTPQSDQALTRVETLKSGMFWHVWAQFHPTTDINRLTEAVTTNPSKTAA